MKRKNISDRRELKFTFEGIDDMIDDIRAFKYFTDSIELKRICDKLLKGILDYGIVCHGEEDCVRVKLFFKEYDAYLTYMVGFSMNHKEGYEKSNSKPHFMAKYQAYLDKRKGL